MSGSKRKRERIPSLSLDKMLHSVNDDNTVDSSTRIKLQTALANTDLREVLKNDGIPEDLVLLWTVSKIGFFYTVLLKKCITRVPKAMLTHRRKYILEEFNKLTNNSLNNAGMYIDLMLLDLMLSSYSATAL